MTPLVMPQGLPYAFPPPAHPLRLKIETWRPQGASAQPSPIGCPLGLATDLLGRTVPLIPGCDSVSAAVGTRIRTNFEVGIFLDQALDLGRQRIGPTAQTRRRPLGRSVNSHVRVARGGGKPTLRVGSAKGSQPAVNPKVGVSDRTRDF